MNGEFVERISNVACYTEANSIRENLIGAQF